MTLYYADPWLTVYEGDCRAVLAALPAESVHTVVTSPPYWGLRDYGSAGQLGLEPTPEEYVANMVAVFREVRRVLRADGTLWLNLGDSYVAGQGGRQSAVGEMPAKPLYKGANPHKRTDVDTGSWGERDATAKMTPARGTTFLKPKDLVGIPWRVAFALQADGWYLRSDIIWSKPNPMPESVTDRPTKAHEYLFLLSKSPRYYYDADAVREPHDERYAQRRFTGAAKSRTDESWRDNGQAPHSGFAKMLSDEPTTFGNPAGRNLRSVWTVATQPYPGAHFATFPPKLIEPAIKAGTSERGVCPDCGAPWERVVELRRGAAPKERGGKNYGATAQGTSESSALRKVGGDDWYAYAGSSETTGWRPSCRHIAPDGERVVERPDGTTEIVPTWSDAIATSPARVLDPFAGSGTTGMVAQSLSRRAVLIDLNGEYLTQAMARNRDIPLGLDVA